jgi:hypothetical protein
LEDESSIRNFQDDLTALEQWAAKWSMSFNVLKCNIMMFGRAPKALNRNKMTYNISGDEINSVK